MGSSNSGSSSSTGSSKSSSSKSGGGYANAQSVSDSMGLSRGGIGGSYGHGTSSFGGSSSGGSGGTYRGYTPNQVRGIMGSGLGGMVFGGSSKDAATWAARQKAAALAKKPVTAQELYHGIAYTGIGGEFGALNNTIDAINKSDLSTLDKSIAVQAARNGELKSLSDFGIDTTEMRDAYSSPIDKISSFFGKDVEDVQTPDESLNALIDSGHVSIDQSGKIQATPKGAASAMSTPLGFFGGLAGGLIGSAFGPIGSMAGSYLGQMAVPSNPYDYSTAENISGIIGDISGIGPVARLATGFAGDMNMANQMNLAGVSSPNRPASGLMNNRYGDQGYDGIDSVYSPATSYNDPYLYDVNANRLLRG